MRQVVFDLETTGFRFDEGHRVVEIGGVELVRGALTGRTFHTYVNPERDMPEGAFKVHGLSETFLKGFPVFADRKVSRAFVDFVGDAELIAHNGVSFDVPFINAELAGVGMAALTNSIIDTLHLARRKFPGSPASLDALCSRFGVDTSRRERDGHGALLDSRLLAQVYIELTGGLQAGLDFAVEGPTAAERQETKVRGARVRPHAIGRLLTKDEAAAHSTFVEKELGPANLWARHQAQS
ncbi:MAG: DNA polymerase III subunit epsilon [Alphaproteobacteria bacterium RIFCSPHIGHO2_12_FULL_63_12]|nr:MAG: DNA polymerase III subunit epsilon [Alphaproteobacteria bacterium RIFCSPHIGHO2_12_FULL_63_12]